MDGSVCFDGEYDLIPIDVCRQLLGAEAAGLSDEEVDRVRRHADALAHILVELAQEVELRE